MSDINTLHLLIDPDMIETIYNMQQKTKEHLKPHTKQYHFEYELQATNDHNKDDDNFTLIVKIREELNYDVRQDLIILLDDIIMACPNEFVKRILRFSVN